MSNSNSKFLILPIKPENKPSVASFIADSWGSPISVSKGKVHNTTELPGFIYEEDNEVIGLVTYNMNEKDCEIVTLDSRVNNIGLGTRLVQKVIEVAKRSKCKRVWLVTTNDNTYAIRFYQKRGFEWIGFYKNVMQESRKLKPEIPIYGFDNIPINHEIEFEYRINIDSQNN